MTSASTRTYLIMILDRLGFALADPDTDLRAALSRLTSEIAQRLRDDVHQKGSPPGESAPQQPASITEQQPEVLEVRENGALLKIRDQRGIRHVERCPNGWREI